MGNSRGIDNTLVISETNYLCFRSLVRNNHNLKLLKMQLMTCALIPFHSENAWF